LLIPTSDETLCAVSRHKSALEAYYIVACTDWAITQQFIDKKRTYALAESIGIAAPRTAVPHSAEEVEIFSHKIEYPCLVKPCQSHLYFERFRRKMVRVENFDQMHAAWSEAFQVGLETMLQELIPGDDAQGVNYNSYMWDGEPLAEFTAAKVRNAPPELGSPRVVVSRHIPEVLEPGRSILKAMGFQGYSCTEFKKDIRDGVYKLMEVNGRHNRSGMLAVSCGVNFPWLQYRHLVLGEKPSRCDYRTDVYWIDILRDLGFSLKCFRSEGYSLAEYLHPYRSPHIFAVLDGNDPKPSFIRGLHLVEKLV
jgi:predicted ATP-grasp superfamily ATP-dependent carboligase